MYLKEALQMSERTRVLALIVHQYKCTFCPAVYVLNYGIFEAQYAMTFSMLFNIQFNFLVILILIYFKQKMKF